MKDVEGILLKCARDDKDAKEKITKNQYLDTLKLIMEKTTKWGESVQIKGLNLTQVPGSL